MNVHFYIENDEIKFRYDYEPQDPSQTLYLQLMKLKGKKWVDKYYRPVMEKRDPGCLLAGTTWRTVTSGYHSYLLGRIVRYLNENLCNDTKDLNSLNSIL